MKKLLGVVVVLLFVAACATQAPAPSVSAPSATPDNADGVGEVDALSEELNTDDASEAAQELGQIDW